MQIRVVVSAAATLAVLFISACASAGETAVIVERPQAPTVPVTPAPADTTVAAAPTVNPLDTVTVGRFDTGKMWTFDNPPVDYFQEAYGFRPDTAWFNHARLGALRFATYCSASFVSPFGLVMTNHHCGRESITAVTKPGEDLQENGFYASSLEAERPVKDLYVDQLIKITDVTDQVSSRIRSIADDEQRARVLQETTDQIEEQMTSEAKLRDTTLYVQVIELYNGGKYSAYTFHRYHDVRLVMAPEEQIAFFGGAPDNFTYPRYDLDMS
ncbi:MAG TPA: S46 family peptidase, partial [Rhodothermales bacterium]|nr:S46 family peptidase [Rhodothermales bacterium]